LLQLVTYICRWGAIISRAPREITLRSCNRSCATYRRRGVCTFPSRSLTRSAGRVDPIVHALDLTSSAACTRYGGPHSWLVHTARSPSALLSCVSLSSGSCNQSFGGVLCGLDQGRRGRRQRIGGPLRPPSRTVMLERRSGRRRVRRKD